MEIPHKALGWDQPFPIQLANTIRSRFGEGGSYDDLLIWVPSSRFGRHLLGELFKEETAALHPPYLVTPSSYCATWCESVANVASEAERLVAWRRVFERIPRHKLEPLFPALAGSDRMEVPFDLVGQLVQLQDELAELLLTAEKITLCDVDDLERWLVLAELEQLYFEELEARGRMDPNRAMEQMDSIPEEFRGCKTLLIAGIHNLTPRQAALIEVHRSIGLSVECLWPVPESYLCHLDGWGRPLADFWEAAEIPDSFVESAVQKTATPAIPIREVIQLARDYGEPVDVLGIVACEEDVRDTLIESAALSGVDLYNPDGELLHDSLLGRCLQLCLNWRKEGRLQTLDDLLQHDLFRAWCVALEMDPVALQQSLFDVRTTYFIENYEYLLQACLKRSMDIQSIRQLVETMDTTLFGAFESGFLQGIWTLLRAILPIDGSVDAVGLPALIEELNSEFNGQLSEEDGEELLPYLMRMRRFYPERTHNERPISGWLEAAWEISPHLVVLGLPDTKVPGPKNKSLFITPGLLQRLGLPGHREKAAFDALRLRILLEGHRTVGKLQIIHYQRTLGDNPVMPCRFLFNTTEGNTVRRTAFLMQGEVLKDEIPAAHFGTQFRLPEPVIPQSISISALNTYLNHPLQYYLQYILGWKPFEAMPLEMNPRQFGGLAHSVLEAYAREANTFDFRKEGAIAAFVRDILDHGVEEQFGRIVPVQVQVQIDSLKQRLHHTCTVLEGFREDGWVVVDAEWNFKKNAQVSIGSMRLSGIIDLILHHPENNTYLVIDYKTSDDPKAAEAAHSVAPKVVEENPFLPERYWMKEGKLRRWTNLQLPLYVHALHVTRGHFAECGYINLAKTVGKIEFSHWKIADHEVLAAVECAEAIVCNIRKKCFPIPEKYPYTDLHLPWFGGDFRATIESDWQRRFMEVRSE